MFKFLRKSVSRGNKMLELIQFASLNLSIDFKIVTALESVVIDGDFPCTVHL